MSISFWGGFIAITISYVFGLGHTAVRIKLQRKAFIEQVSNHPLVIP